MKKTAALVFAAAMAYTHMASAKDINANDPIGMADAMRDLGYQAKLEKDHQGDPMIRSSVSGVRYSIYFYGCTEGKDCNGIQFSAVWDLENGIDMDSINTWNEERIVGKAYIDDERDPYLEYFVTTKGGLTEENFEDAVDWWRVAVGQFINHIEETEA
ncbi:MULTISPECIES: YbjN domain-containing protein [Pseudovibrio]|uniref:YbjN domain-containing protein n=1 Tax=Stappiaceae TaxID=2821832 RepID=UPI0023659AE6|nr:MULTISPECIES: YbjN domain-containing protein [Pseudovibrio]MDD7909256.1 YbjN domain-containing protein [Pseudovibrio exalbescens]MDX5595197.1 YbjN domain-containing protein [Pseudovibrio sp. SPO723]